MVTVGGFRAASAGHVEDTALFPGQVRKERVSVFGKCKVHLQEAGLTVQRNTFFYSFNTNIHFGADFPHSLSPFLTFIHKYLLSCATSQSQFWGSSKEQCRLVFDFKELTPYVLP